VTEKPTPITPGYPVPQRGTLWHGRISVIVGWSVVGLILGLICGWLAFGLGGLGHGWTSAASVSWLALLTFPLTGVALALRRRLWGKGLGLLLFMTALVSHIILVSNTYEDGADHFARVWSNEPGLVVVWAALWGTWQVGAVAALLSPGDR